MSNVIVGYEVSVHETLHRPIARDEHDMFNPPGPGFIENGVIGEHLLLILNSRHRNGLVLLINGGAQHALVTYGDLYIHKVLFISRSMIIQVIIRLPEIHLESILSGQMEYLNVNYVVCDVVPLSIKCQ